MRLGTLLETWTNKSKTKDVAIRTGHSYSYRLNEEVLSYAEYPEAGQMVPGVVKQPAPLDNV